MKKRMVIAAAIGAGAIFAQSVVETDAAINTRAIATRVMTNVPHITALRTTLSAVDPRYQRALATGAVPVVYVSQLLNGTVLAYPTGTSAAPTAPVEVISGLTDPQGLAVDARGNLYVGELNDVKVFAPGSTAVKKVLTGASLIDNVAVDSRGTVYVLTSQATAAKIFVYRNGATTPSYTLTDPAIDIVLDMAVDAVGNIFIVYVGTDFVLRVGAFTSLGPLLVPLQIDSNAGPFSLALDQSGNLLVGSGTANPAIGIFGPAMQAAKASVAVATGPQGRALFALSTGNHHLYVAPQDDGVIEEYAYPAGGLQQKITLPPFASAQGPLTDFTTGIAVSPAPSVGSW